MSGSALIVFITWFQVEVSVRLNEWYGEFYNLIQKALATPNSITLTKFYSELSDGVNYSDGSYYCCGL
ncbi:SbmA/BacA-like family transporter [Vibrio salinus]|uniref:SbmA/BacA-like family transporter n=1 Tax=Vibrio salinus TaxID=2899784 RepID=UPI003568C163